MKKLILTLSICMLASCLFAQTYPPALRVNLYGTNINNLVCGTTETNLIGQMDTTLYFTTAGYDPTWSAPSFAAETLADSDFVWTRPDTSTFTGKTPSITNFQQLGTYSIRLLNGKWGNVTRILFLQSTPVDWIRTWNVGDLLYATTNLTFLYCFRNINLVDDIGDWTLPNGMLRLFLYSSTLVSGDIGNWILPTTLTHLYLPLTSVSGDIAQVTGTLDAAQILRLYRVSNITYSASNSLFSSTNMFRLPTTGGSVDREIRVDNNNLSSNSVDNILVDCDISGVRTNAQRLSITLNVGGASDSAPTLIGYTAKTNLIAKGWSVTTK